MGKDMEDMKDVVQEENTENVADAVPVEEKVSFKGKVLSYLKALPKRYFITAFSGMAQGLFVTLIAGTILEQIGKLIGNNYFGNVLVYIGYLAKFLMGAGIGVGIAHALGKNKLLVFAAAVAGLVGSFSDFFMAGALDYTVISTKLLKGLPGNPIGAYVTTMLVVEIVGLYAGKTKLDILIVPLGAMLLSFVGVYVSFPFVWVVNQLGTLIAIATKATPFFMGIIISIIMGILLTLPTSSAAIWVAVSAGTLTGLDMANITELQEAMLLAGGAATVGCACHMVGFGVATYRENGFSGLIAQGVGTSMLQIPNVMRKPIIMLPSIISSAILGPMSTCLFKLKCGVSGGGMGTSGFVGVIDLFKYTQGALGIVGIILCMFVLPALISFAVSEFMRKKNLVKPEDLKLPD